MDSRIWVPKPGAPPYVSVTQADIWNTVKNKWTSLGSPEAQCPSPRFGEVGSAENNACRSFVEPIWNNMDSVFPQLPSFGPYNSIQDLVPVEEVCALGIDSDPEADIGPPPNLFENPGGLVQKLSEWYLRSLIPTLCELAPTKPTEGACFCWPYYVTVTFRHRSQYSGLWSEPLESRGACFGPFYGVGVRVSPPEDGGQFGYLIFAEGQRNPGGLRYGTINDCQLGRQEYPIASGGGYDDAEILSVDSVVPFTPEDVAFAGLGYAARGPSDDGFCPRPDVAPPMPSLPNSTPLYMPLPVPIFSFPPGNSCPPPENNMDFTVNLVSIPGPPGVDGIQGKDGKDGPTMIETIIKTEGEAQVADIDMGSGYNGGVFYLPRHCAYVKIRFKVSGVTQANYSERRVFFEPLESSENRKEISLGNAYLRLNNTNDGTLERIQLSMEQTLIPVPKSPENERWKLVVNDKGDVGFEIIDLGYRHVLRRLDNPDEVEALSYYGP